MSQPFPFFGVGIARNRTCFFGRRASLAHAPVFFVAFPRVFQHEL
jgi:hypothetical protein